MEALPSAIAIVGGADLQVARMNTAFTRIIERVPGFAGSHSTVAERMLREADLPKRMSAASVTGAPQRRIRVAVNSSERITLTLYPVRKREHFLLIVDSEAPGDTQGGDP